MLGQSPHFPDRHYTSQLTRVFKFSFFTVSHLKHKTSNRQTDRPQLSIIFVSTATVTIPTLTLLLKRRDAPLDSRRGISSPDERASGKAGTRVPGFACTGANSASSQN